ncbi:MAG: class I SAM-dependent methyltransferase [Pseudomonadales bacterium]|jgi:SAM-dependent methyltransferase|nr:class I SAM-dependent methyltransferase [Pseudomonadales bacterium]
MSDDNAAQIEYWNGQAGRTWVEAQARLDRMMAPLSEQLLDAAGPLAGASVLDVGCGCGDTSLALAVRGARVHGIDVSEPMLTLARSRAQAIEGVSFQRADAATEAFEATRQLLFSRFGVMFFADPVAAFRNLRGALEDEGRLCFLCWQGARQNPWMSVAGRAVQPFLPAPATPPDPRAPGPFAFAEADYVHGILEAAGYTAIEIDALTPVLHLADDLDEAIAFQQQVGPLARALAELEGPIREQALDAARAALAPHLGPRGLELASACWLVRARAA